jgi:hypothetical protein
MLDSENIPDVPTQIGHSEMLDLFRNFTFNWDTLSPALWLLFGTLLGFSIFKMIKNRFVD